MLLLSFFLSGIIVGSFLNVCIYRLPKKESIISPPSHCVHCKKRILWWDLIPVFSYIWLRGHCRYCGTSISLRYPLIELLTGSLFVFIYLSLGLKILLIKYLFLASILIVLSFIDLEYYFIPDKIILFALLGGLVLSITLGDFSFFSALTGFLAPIAFLTIMALVSKGGIGGGDIKLSGAIGFFLGWPYGMIAVVLACCLAGVAGIGLLLLKRKGRKDPIPFAPYLSAGTLISFFWGKYLLNWYFTFMGKGL